MVAAPGRPRLAARPDLLLVLSRLRAVEGGRDGVDGHVLLAAGRLDAAPQAGVGAAGRRNVPRAGGGADRRGIRLWTVVLRDVCLDLVGAAASDQGLARRRPAPGPDAEVLAAVFGTAECGALRDRNDADHHALVRGLRSGAGRHGAG